MKKKKTGCGLQNSKLKTLHENRTKFLESTLQDMNSPEFLSGESFTYADIFLFTCVRATQKCSGFKILRDAYGGDPFGGKKNILAICDRIENRPKVKNCISDKFEKAPF